jgi:hypothetical protein
MHNYCTPHIIKENFVNFLIYRCNYVPLSQAYCVQVIKTPTIFSNKPVYIYICIHTHTHTHARTQNLCPESSEADGIKMCVLYLQFGAKDLPRNSFLLHQYTASSVFGGF